MSSSVICENPSSEGYTNAGVAMLPNCGAPQQSEKLRVVNQRSNGHIRNLFSKQPNMVAEETRTLVYEYGIWYTLHFELRKAREEAVSLEVILSIYVLGALLFLRATHFFA